MTKNIDKETCAIVIYHEDPSRRAFLAETLHSIAGQTTPPGHLILVSNGSSLDPLEAWRMANGERARTSVDPIEFRENRNVAFAKGHALERAIGRSKATGVQRIAVFDFNACPGKTWFEKCSGALSEDQNLASVGGEVRDWMDPRRIVSCMHGQKDAGTIDHGYLQSDFAHDKDALILGACTCAGMYSVEHLRKVYDRFGGFIEPTIEHYYDCTDLLARLHAVGGKTKFVADAKAKKEKFPRDFAKDKIRRHREVRNRLWIATNHYTDERQQKVIQTTKDWAFATRSDVAQAAILDAEKMPKLVVHRGRRWLNELDAG
jgi:GT2 family glycosyltransferase